MNLPVIRVLFVCLGNICRSPMAEGSFRHQVKMAGLDAQIECDSCGTADYHVGEPPDPRMIRTAAEKGIDIRSLSGRQLRRSDFHEFDYILAMDASNRNNILRLRKQDEGKARLEMMRLFDPDVSGTQDVPDPWYGGPEDFEEVFQILHRSCEKLLDHLCTQHQLRKEK